jgi:TonB-dependent starch-binding outer membrane protein SusC
MSMQKPFTAQSLLWLTMKLTITPLLLLVWLAGLSYASPTNGQNILNKRVTLRAENVPMRQALDRISEQTSVKFVYSDRAIQVGRPVTVQATNQSLGVVLDQLLQPLAIAYDVKNDRIILRRQTANLKTLAPAPAPATPASSVADRTVSGKVTDEGGQPLPGVSVVLKGTVMGTTTNAQGVFNFTIPDGKQTIVFSFIGYTTKEVDATNGNTFNVVLEASSNALDEVVVVGYGTQSKREVISSIGTVGADKITKVNGASFEQALQGNVSGLRINVAGGDPDAETRIQIRGTKSITAGTEPFILIDGVPITNGAMEALNTINPNDIQNVSVLKDAAATSIYGSRGANGVILITTKSGKSGKGQFSYRYEQGITKPINQPELANGTEWRGLLATARTNSGFKDPTTGFLPIRLPLFDQRNSALTRYTNLDLYNTTDTDWAKLVIRDGQTKSHTFSVSKGTENANYYISGNYFDQQPNWVGTRFQRYTGRVNLGFQPSKLLKIDVRNTYSFTDNERRPIRGSTTNILDPNLNYGAWGGYWALYSSSLPVFPERWPDTGAPFDPYGGNNLTYSTDRDNASDNQKINRNLSSISFVLTPLKNLTVQSDLGVDYTQTRNNSWISRRLRAAPVRAADLSSARPDTLSYIYDGSARFDKVNLSRLNLNANITARYETTFASVHKVSGLIGYEVTDQRNSSSVTRTQSSSSRVENIEGLSRTMDQFLEITNVEGSDVRFLSYFGRFNYNLKDRYQFQASLRRDGSSNFSPSHRFAWFPSVAGGWVVSEEPTFKQRFSSINYLKLKASWGQTGNSNIPPFAYIGASYENWPTFSNNSAAYVQTQIASGNIRWEKSSTTDLGVEFGFFNRLTGSVGYFQSLTSDMLFTVPLAPTIGIYGGNNSLIGALANIGSMQNWGWEFELNSINFQSGKSGFKWTTDLNLTLNKNKLISLYDGFNGSPTTLSINNLTTVQLGKPIGMFYLPVFAGYDANGNPTIKEIDKEAASRQEYIFTGRTIVPTATEVVDNSVVMDGKTGLPTYFGGLTNTFSYRGLSLSCLFYFQGGNYIYDNMPNLRNVGSGQNVLRKELVTESWSPQNPDAYFRIPSWTSLELGAANAATAKTVSDQSDRFLQKGDFIRLKTISLSYQLPSALLKKTPISNVNLFMNLNNVATFTQVRGFDPELVYTGVREDAINGRGTTAAQRNLGQGLVNFMPPIQVFSMNWGVNVNF